MPATRNEQIASLFLSGSTYQEIGDHFGISRERVRQLIKGMGIQAQEGGHAIQAGVRLERAVELYQGGQTVKEAARAAGCDERRLAAALKSRRMLRRPEMLKHGTVSRYQHGRCRCAKCRKANTDYRRKLALDRRAGPVLDSGARVPTTKGAA